MASGVSASLVLIEIGAIVAVLLGALTVLARRRGRGLLGSSRRCSTPLTATHAVHVVELEGRRLLVGTGPSGAPRLLCELGEAAGSGAHDPTTVGAWNDGR